MKNILIGGAWPYANGSLHIGHIAALLPGDVLARYHRAIGNTVFYVSGSDCHGTPITIRAKQEGKSPKEISDYYHGEFLDVFKKLGFSYDLYTKTSDPHHIEYVREFHKKVYQGNYIQEKTLPQAFCTCCNKVLTDRYLVGKCPSCGTSTRGDQCDACGELLEPDSIIDSKCSDCGTPPELRITTQLYLNISKLTPELTAYLNQHENWRKNAIAFTTRYIEEGLRDRAITRDLDWGIHVPRDGYHDKRIYIWAENVLGYLSASAALCTERCFPFQELFGENSKHYYVHGKDNIPFHTIILPALLLAHGGGFRLPDEIISSEYLTLEGRKISTSQNWAIWAKDLVGRYNPDAIRYFLIANGPEKRDTDFSWREFLERNNSELLGAFGNFVNRTLAFIVKFQESKVPDGTLDINTDRRINDAFQSIGKGIENGQFKESLEQCFELVRFGNKYFDSQEPWHTRTSNPNACAQTLYTCVQLIANLAVLLGPFLPFTTEKIRSWLKINEGWTKKDVNSGLLIPEPEILFERLEKQIIDAEVAKLINQQSK